MVWAQVWAIIEPLQHNYWSRGGHVNQVRPIKIFPGIFHMQTRDFFLLDSTAIAFVIILLRILKYLR